MQGLIPQDWAVVDYYISPEVSFAFVVRKGEPVALVPLDLDYSLFFAYVERIRKVKRVFVGQDENKKDIYNEYPELSVVRNNKDYRILGLNCSDIYQILFAPVVDLLGDVKNVLVIPHDVLWLFPYEIMISPVEGEDEFMLSQGWNFAEIPSASLIVHGSKGYRSNASSIAVVANPEYFYYDKNEAPKDVQDKLNDLLANAESPIDAAVRLNAGYAMTPLAGTQKEADSILSIWEEASRDITYLVGADASEVAIASADIGSHGYVHFACHGYDRNSISFLQPGLALSPAADRGNDSFAQMGELAAINWRSRLVVLSACDTGLGDLYVGDGMVGLNSVFLSGGVQGVVVSRWLVPDKDAPVIMESMYSDIAAGVSPAEALNRAKRHLWDIRENKTGEVIGATGWAVLKYVGIPWEIESK
ncbi:MAG: CHAT domain-containing protein [Synergistales bacterium]|nr:CHAT domain-containing protein [Synergistales bacterium]